MWLSCRNQSPHTINPTPYQFSYDGKSRRGGPRHGCAVAQRICDPAKGVGDLAVDTDIIAFVRSHTTRCKAGFASSQEVLLVAGGQSGFGAHADTTGPCAENVVFGAEDDIPEPGGLCRGDCLRKRRPAVGIDP